MPSKLIELEEGILVEVEVPEGQAQQISGGLAHKVNSTIDKIKPTLVSVARPLALAWEEINQDMDVENAEIELGFSFETEGNIYIAKVKGDASISVKLVLKPRRKPSGRKPAN